MSNYLYSFIIPHKNSPIFLERCIMSIPNRSDIQIIVVDDNSDPAKRPIVKRDNVDVVYLTNEESRGAGKARNVGLQRAQGKWVLFADSDDYYEKGFLEILDKHSSKSINVIYFGVDYVDCKTLDHIPKFENYNKALKDSTDENSHYDYIKYKISAPWNKMVSHDFIVSNKISFEEVIQGNDVWFTYQVGFTANSILAEPSHIYNYTKNSDGITSNKSIERCLAELESTLKMNEFYKFIHHPEWHISILLYLLSSFKMVKSPFKLLVSYLYKWRYFNEIKFKYVNSLKNN